jgi:uncharacterized protein YbaP (TraB family)
MTAWMRVLVGVGLCAVAAMGAAQAPVAVPPAAAAKPAEPTVMANPAIWRVKGKHGTVYLFGSVHVMKPNVQWETPKVKSAFDASDLLYLEVANLDDTAALQPMLLQSGLDAAHPLSTKISKEDLALLDAAVKSMGLPGEQMMEPMQPWLVSVTLSVLPMMKDGFAPTSGIDTTLLADEKAAQKPVKGFETMQEQMHLMADLPEAQQVAMLHRDLTELDKSAADTNALVAAWEVGDVEKIGKIDNDELATKYPAEYKRMVVDRNVKWAATLDGLLKDPTTGTVFVAVGAAHLAGPDSVIKMLEKDGWKVERE